MTQTLCIGDITFDANHPSSLARFWAEALDYELENSDEQIASAIDPHRKHPRLVFQKSRCAKSGKNRLHMDLFAADPETEVQRLMRLGAQIHHHMEEDGVAWTVMLDPEGNEFCVQARQW